MSSEVEELRSQISEHQQVISEWQAKVNELRLPPIIPPGSSGQRIAEIFEAAAGRDDVISGAEAALSELRRRESILVQRLAGLEREEAERQEHQRHSRMTQDLLSVLN